MSEASSSPEKTTVNIRITETFLSDVDATWEDLGYNSRSEFVRDVLRDAVKHPEFNRADLSSDCCERGRHSGRSNPLQRGDQSGVRT